MKSDENDACVRLLAVDPSSTITGYAVWHMATKYVEHRGTAKVSGSMSAIERIQAISKSLKGVAMARKITHAVIELPSGKVHARIRETSKGAGLSVYGMAAGYIFKMLVDLLGDENVYFYLDNEWTGNGKCKTYGSKKQRQRLASLLDHDYHSAKDSGMDISDAICLGHYHLAQLKLKRLREQKV